MRSVIYILYPLYFELYNLFFYFDCAFIDHNTRVDNSKKSKKSYIVIKLNANSLTVEFNLPCINLYSILEKNLIQWINKEVNGIGIVINKQKLFRFKEILGFLLIFIIGLALRLIHLNSPLSFDEVCSWAFARRTPFVHMWSVALSDPTPPLYYAVLHFTMRFLGDTPALMRIPSVVFGMLILPLVYWCMRQGSFSKEDRLYAVTVVAVSSMLVYYSQDLRAYSMLAFFGVLSVGLLFRCLRNPILANNLIYAVTIFILSYTHRYSLLLIAAQIICIVLYRRWQTLAASLSTSALILLLLVIQIFQGKFSYSYAIDRVTNMGSVIALINMLNVGTIELRSITGLQPSPYVSYPHLSINVALSIIGLITFSIIFLLGLFKLKEYTPVQRQYIIVLGICIVVPSMLALLAGTRFVPKPQWLLRGLIYVWPLYYMAAVIAFSKSRFKIYLIAIVVILNGFSLYPYYNMFSRCEQAAALEQLNTRTTGKDLVIANPWYFYEAINYYYHGSAQRAGYEKTRGWVDLKRLRESENVFTQYLPLTSPPHINGNVYFFWWIDDLECVKPFHKNNIFVYDGKGNSWKRYMVQNSGY